jgi:hypothetical protein
LFGKRTNNGGLYRFRATVVGPAVSYCLLQDDFAVEVYGVPLTEGGRAGVLIGFALLMIGALVVTYLYYRGQRASMSLVER